MAPLFELLQPKHVLWAAFRQRLHENLHIVLIRPCEAGGSAVPQTMLQHCHVDHYEVTVLTCTSYMLHNHLHTVHLPSTLNKPIGAQRIRPW